MKKYWFAFLIELQNHLTYRLSFFFWHLNQILTFLTPLFVWSALLRHQAYAYNYSPASLMTYVFGTLALKPLVFSSTTYELASIINRGDLSTYLLKPISLFKYYFARDLAHKLMNIVFLVFELPLLYLLFKPTLYLQTNWSLLLAFALSVFLALGLYFYLSFIFGTIGFWSQDTWAPRFLLLVLLEFATGSIFPLDMLPSSLHFFVQLLPFSYMMFVPLQIYLGQVSAPLLSLVIAATWLFILYLLTRFIYQRGLTRYEAEGH